MFTGMLLFDRSGPVNTGAIVDMVVKESAKYEYIVVASVTGDNAVKVAEKIRDKKIVCVTCPRGCTILTDDCRNIRLALDFMAAWLENVSQKAQR